MDVVEKARTGLYQSPTDQFTIKREEHKMIEDIKLISHFAPWISSLTGKTVNADTICEDLLDGEALCNIMSQIKGSGVTVYHKTGSGFGKLDSFKAMENMVQFHEACKKLALPVQCGREELVQGNLGKLASCLVFVAHTCASQGIGIKQMDDELRHRLESVAGVTENLDFSGTGDQLNWWQQLLLKFGLGDYLQYFDLNELKAYAAKVKENTSLKAEEVKLLMKQKSDEIIGKLPDALQQKLH